MIQSISLTGGTPYILYVSIYLTRAHDTLHAHTFDTCDTYERACHSMTSQKSPIISGSFAIDDLQLKAFYDSTPPCTGWRRRIGCLTLQVIFRKRATNYRALLRKITYKDKASYESTPCSTSAHATVFLVVLHSNCAHDTLCSIIVSHACV